MINLAKLVSTIEHLKKLSPELYNEQDMKGLQALEKVMKEKEEKKEK